MENVLIVIHLLLVVALIGLVLLQKSEGGALGMGGGNSVMSSRGAANALTRLTGICAAGFFVTSLALTFIAGQGVQSKSILDRAVAPVENAAPVQPKAPAVPSVPLSSAPTSGTPVAVSPSAVKPTPDALKPSIPATPSVPTTSAPVQPVQKPVVPNGKQ